ncbi:MAG TPA: FAD-dependent oxidoreductase, partial [Kofleriaceae bacterium]|nr:FAD-dependent oxidoreductase [Kofleriaceae bacterium]
MHGSYWHTDASWRDRWTDTPVPKHVDFAIIGAGFAGLSTAIRLREQNPSAQIIVLEAERVGFGASGRNAGFLSPLAAPVWLLGAQRSVEQAWGAARINAEVHAIARSLEQYDCELAPATLALQAQSRLADAALREFAKAVELVGLEHRVVESRARPGRLYLEMSAYTLHPYKLALGLAEHAERHGITIRERTRVQSVEALRAGGARVKLDDASSFEAAKVVVCTNAYTPSIDVGERVAALVVHSFMAATEPAEVARDGDFTVEINATQGYHRMHRGRVIYGGIDKLRMPDGDDFAVPLRERQKLESALHESFPHAALTTEHAWSGRFHATATGLPIIRMATENHAIVFNVGYGGTGVALSLVCARLAAAVASHGRFTNVDDTRLLALIHGTRISVRDSVRAIARIARGA